MKKSLVGFTCGIMISGLFAFSVINYESKKNTAEVEQIQGYYIFAKSKPVQEFEHLGVVKGPKIGNHEFDKLVESLIKEAKKEFPNGDALLFDGGIRQTHNTSVSVIKFKN